MKGRKSGAVAMFIGLFLIVVFFMGMAVDNNPRALMRNDGYDRALELFGVFLGVGFLGSSKISTNPAFANIAASFESHSITVPG